MFFWWFNCSFYYYFHIIYFLWIHLGFEPRTPECKSGMIASFTNDPNGCGGGTRTHVIRLMRPSWNHLQSTPQFLIIPNSVYLVLPTGFEPVTPSLKVRCSKPTELREIVEVPLRFELRTHDYKSSVLPTKLQNLAEEVGFEPTVPFQVHWFSRPAR